MGFAAVAALMTAVVGTTMYGIYHASWDGHLDWQSATLAHVTESPLASATTLLYSRIACGAVVWLTCAYLVTSREAIEIQYGRRTIQLVGWTRFTTFTVWCWTLMGIYFALAAAMSAVRVSVAAEGSLEHVHGNLFFPPWALMAVWVLYELSFAMSLLVFVVVTFVLIPAATKYGYNTDALFKWAPLVMHNCNVAFMFLELYLNGMQFNAWHVMFVILYGCLYIVFAWYWFTRTGVFYYFFLDYRHKWAVVSYLALIGAVAGFFALGDVLSNALKPRVDF